MSILMQEIILIGMPITFFYNWCAAILQAAGDTQIPLYILLIAMGINTILDFVFVAGMHMGTSGTAIATVTAQLVATIICICIMKKKHKEFFFHRKDMAIDVGLMKKQLSLALFQHFISQVFILENS